MTIKQVAPSSMPQSATLTLYSINDTNFYTYDLTSSLNTATVNTWNNLTIPLGPNASGWAITGTPSWGNITALQLSLTYPANSNITVRIGALFFRGQYQTPVQTDSLGLIEQFLSSYGFRVHFSLVRLNRHNLPVLLRIKNHSCLETPLCRHRLRIVCAGHSGID